MSKPTDAGEDDGARPSDHDRRRMRGSLRVLAAGGGLAAAGALATGLAGGSGRAGALVLLLVGAVGCGVAGLHALVLALVDDLGDRGVARRRVALALGLLLASGLLVAMAGAGVAAAG